MDGETEEEGKESGRVIFRNFSANKIGAEQGVPPEFAKREVGGVVVQLNCDAVEREVEKQGQEVQLLGCRGWAKRAQANEGGGRGGARGRGGGAQQLSGLLAAKLVVKGLQKQTLFDTRRQVLKQ